MPPLAVAGKKTRQTAGCSFGNNRTYLESLNFKQRTELLSRAGTTVAELDWDSPQTSPSCHIHGSCDQAEDDPSASSMAEEIDYEQLATEQQLLLRQLLSKVQEVDIENQRLLAQLHASEEEKRHLKKRAANVEVHAATLQKQLLDDTQPPRDSEPQARIAALVTPDLLAVSQPPVDYVFCCEPSPSKMPQALQRIDTLQRQRDQLQAQLQSTTNRTQQLQEALEAATAAAGRERASWQKSQEAQQASLLGAVRRLQYVTGELRKRDAAILQKDTYIRKLEARLVAQHRLLRSARRNGHSSLSPTAMRPAATHSNTVDKEQEASSSLSFAAGASTWDSPGHAAGSNVPTMMWDEERQAPQIAASMAPSNTSVEPSWMERIVADIAELDGHLGVLKHRRDIMQGHQHSDSGAAANPSARGDRREQPQPAEDSAQEPASEATSRGQRALQKQLPGDSNTSLPTASAQPQLEQPLPSFAFGLLTDGDDGTATHGQPARVLVDAGVVAHPEQAAIIHAPGRPVSPYQATNRPISPSWDPSPASRPSPRLGPGTPVSPSHKRRTRSRSPDWVSSPAPSRSGPNADRPASRASPTHQPAPPARTVGWPLSSSPKAHRPLSPAQNASQPMQQVHGTGVHQLRTANRPVSASAAGARNATPTSSMRGPVLSRQHAGRPVSPAHSASQPVHQGRGAAMHHMHMVDGPVGALPAAGKHISASSIVGAPLLSWKREGGQTSSSPSPHQRMHVIDRPVDPSPSAHPRRHVLHRPVSASPASTTAPRSHPYRSSGAPGGVEKVDRAVSASQGPGKHSSPARGVSTPTSPSHMAGKRDGSAPTAARHSQLPAPDSAPAHASSQHYAGLPHPTATAGYRRPGSVSQGAHIADVSGPGKGFSNVTADGNPAGSLDARVNTMEQPPQDSSNTSQPSSAALRATTAWTIRADSPSASTTTTPAVRRHGRKGTTQDTAMSHIRPRAAEWSGQGRSSTSERAASASKLSMHLQPQDPSGREASGTPAGSSELPLHEQQSPHNSLRTRQMHASVQSRPAAEQDSQFGLDVSYTVTEVMGQKLDWDSMPDVTEVARRGSVSSHVDAAWHEGIHRMAHQSTADSQPVSRKVQDTFTIGLESPAAYTRTLSSAIKESIAALARLQSSGSPPGSSREAQPQLQKILAPVLSSWQQYTTSAQPATKQHTTSQPATRLVGGPSQSPRTPPHTQAAVKLPKGHTVPDATANPVLKQVAQTNLLGTPVVQRSDRLPKQHRSGR